jgi:hypothetical protein
MKKITLLLIFCLSLVHWSYSQCTNPVYQWPDSVVNIAAAPGIQVIATNNWPQNEYSIIEGLVPGESYTVNTNMATPFYITVTEDDGTTVIVHGAESVSFVATTTGIVIYWTADNLCSDGPSTNTQTQIECTTCICNDNAPLAAITPDPTDGQFSVDILYSGADTLIPLDWEDDLTGGAGPGASYTFYLGVTTTGDDIGSLTVTNSNVLLNYTWAENTTYYWKIDTNNCAGTATSPVWSFTTSACASLGPDPVPSENAPLNMATDVNIDDTDPANLVITFDWNAAAGGDPATSYTLSLGTNPAGDDIGTLTNLDTDVDVTYTWEYETTYYWFVTAQNCGGFSAASPIYSFTTEAALSVDDFSRNSFTHYYDTVEKVLTMESNGTPFDNIQLYNILGQEVIYRNLSQTTEAINMASLKDGIYLAKVTLGGSTQTIKVIKK